MKTGSSTEKIKNGKLVRVDLEHDGVIHKILISGDFFMHPEESIEDIEKSLVGLSVGENEGSIKQVIDQIINYKNVELVGIDTSSLSKLIKQALGE